MRRRAHSDNATWPAGKRSRCGYGIKPPGDAGTSRRDYETVGYVISGRAELVLEGQTVILQPGSSWIVPNGAEHRYHIHETFTAVEVTHPPAEMRNRDATKAP